MSSEKKFRFEYVRENTYHIQRQGEKTTERQFFDDSRFLFFLLLRLPELSALQVEA